RGGRGGAPGSAGEGPLQVSQGGLGVAARAGAEAVGEVFDEGAAGVEERPPLVRVVEVPVVRGEDEVEDLGPQVAVDPGEVVGGGGEGGAGGLVERPRGEARLALRLDEGVDVQYGLGGR